MKLRRKICGQKVGVRTFCNVRPRDDGKISNPVSTRARRAAAAASSASTARTRRTSSWRIPEAFTFGPSPCAPTRLRIGPKGVARGGRFACAGGGAARRAHHCAIGGRLSGLFRAYGVQIGRVLFFIWNGGDSMPRCYDCARATNTSWNPINTTECKLLLGFGERLAPWGDGLQPWDRIDHTKLELTDPLLDHDAERTRLDCLAWLHCSETDAMPDRCDYLVLNARTLHVSRILLLAFLALLFAVPLCEDIDSALIEEKLLDHQLRDKRMSQMLSAIAAPRFALTPLPSAVARLHRRGPRRDRDEPLQRKRLTAQPARHRLRYGGGRHARNAPVAR